MENENDYDRPLASVMNAQGREERSSTRTSSLENGEVTKFYYHKLIRIERVNSLVIILNIFITVICCELTFYQGNTYDSIIIIFLSFNDINAIISILLSVLAALTRLNLEKERKTVHQTSTLLSTKKMFWLIFECSILLLQPHPFLMGVVFQTENSYHKTKFLFPFNDLLAILGLLKIFILVRTLLESTSYMTNRSNRLCKMYGCKSDIPFALKCLFKDNPLLLIIIMFFSSSLIFGYAIYLAERNLSINQFELHVANNILNALWLIQMTITTVGYGDYFPQTFFGRIIIFFVAIWGTFIISIMVVVVTNTLKIEKREKEASIVIKKLGIKNQLREKAGLFIGYCLLSSYAFRKGNKQQMEKYRWRSKKLKREFATIRNNLKLIRNESGLYDEITSHFLNLNSDIDILNQNQDKIINYIHEYLEYQEKKFN